MVKHLYKAEWVIDRLKPIVTSQQVRTNTHVFTNEVVII